MKIIVNNEAEKKLIERFFEAMTDEYLHYVEKEDTRLKEDNFLSIDQYQFLNEALYHARFEVSSDVTPFTVEHEIITGKCKYCGIETKGLIDEEEVDYVRYLELMSAEVQANWECDKCCGKEHE